MSQLEVDKIIPQSGTTLTIGDSGDTITFADGAVIGIDTDTLYIDSTNNRVGIGTSSPSYDLDVVTTGSTADIRLFQDDDGGTTIFRNQIGGTTGNNYFYFGDSTDTNAGVIRYNHTSDFMSFTTNASEVMRIDSSGNVGIGTSSPAHELEIAAVAPILRLTDTDTTATSGQELGKIEFYTNDADGAHVGADIACYSDDSLGRVNGLVFSVSQSNFADATEAMRIDSSGRLQVNTTSINGHISAQNTIGVTPAFHATTSTTSSTGLFEFSNPNGVVGSIATNASATAYNTSSDYRLKENITDAADAGDTIDAIQVRQFDWIVDGSHQDYGMVAQELQTVAPEAVSGNPDSDEMMGVDYSKLVPMLIKEVQSLRARVAELENN